MDRDATADAVMTDALPAIRDALPEWAVRLLDGLDRLPPPEPEDPISGVALMGRVSERAARRLAAELARSRGLHGVQAFLRTALESPQTIALELQALAGTRYTRRSRERLEAATRAFALRIVVSYRMRAWFHRLVHLCFHLGENDVAHVADLLRQLVGEDEAVRKLVRKLVSRDAELREYALYLLAEFADAPAFERLEQRLRGLYDRERDDFVREAYEYLFDFEAGR